MKLKTGYSDVAAHALADLGDTVTNNMTGPLVSSGLSALLTQIVLDVTALPLR